jgi:hypothetical protein
MFSSKKEYLNSNERDLFRKVFDRFCLLREDFQSEAEYDDFLEQRETIAYNFVNNIDRKKSKELSTIFYNKYSKEIGRRQAEKQIAIQRNAYFIQPLLAQIKISEKQSTEQLMRSSMRSINYTDQNYLIAAKKKIAEWEPNADIPYDKVVSLPFEVMGVRAKQELTQSMFMPQ